MRVLYLTIITGVGITVVSLYGAIFFLPSILPLTYQYAESTGLDLSNPSNDNPLGIKAQVIIEPDMFIMCPTRCVIPSTPHLVLTSEKGAQFIGYRACDGTSCKEDKIKDAPYVTMSQIPQNYTGPTGLYAPAINLGNLQWKAGDTVHVIIKAFPVTLEPDDVLIREPLKTTVVDLGESKIIQYNSTNENQSAQVSIARFSKLRLWIDLPGARGYSFQWSHNGKFLVMRECPGTPPSCSFWIVTPDGITVNKITLPNNFIYVYGDKISPTDDSILFAGDYNTYNGTRFKTHTGLFKYDLKEKNLVELDNEKILGPYDWTPDGNIVFVQYNDTVTCLAGINTMACASRTDDVHNIIWLADQEGKKIKKLYNGTEFFGFDDAPMAISPDGAKIILVENEYVYSYKNVDRLAVLDLAKKEIYPLTEYSKIWYTSPIWTHDGRAIIYSAVGKGPVKGQKDGEQIWPAGWLGMISADGSNETNVIFGNTTAPYNPPPLGPVISPDDKKIIFGMDYDFSNGVIKGPGVYELELDEPL